MHGLGVDDCSNIYIPYPTRSLISDIQLLFLTSTCTLFTACPGVMSSTSYLKDLSQGMPPTLLEAVTQEEKEWDSKHFNTIPAHITYPVWFGSVQAFSKSAEDLGLPVDTLQTIELCLDVHIEGSLIGWGWGDKQTQYKAQLPFSVQEALFEGVCAHLQGVAGFGMPPYTNKIATRSSRNPNQLCLCDASGACLKPEGGWTMDGTITALRQFLNGTLTRFIHTTQLEDLAVTQYCNQARGPKRYEIPMTKTGNVDTTTYTALYDLRIYSTAPEGEDTPIHRDVSFLQLSFSVPLHAKPDDTIDPLSKEVDLENKHTMKETDAKEQWSELEEVETREPWTII